jgi:hypothetical protein
LCTAIFYHPTFNFYDATPHTCLHSQTGKML